MSLLHTLCTCSVLLTSPWRATATLSTVDDLSAHYQDIFKTGNRNAASHLWTKFILDRAGKLDAETLTRLFRGFCPVSGSPLPDDPHTRYTMTLPLVGGGRITGISHHCCWPCVCDMQNSVRVDTKTITTTDGPKQYHVLVIGNPCLHPDRLNQQFVDPFSQMTTSLQAEAPEVQCASDGGLVGAVLSDHGHPILGMFFTEDVTDGHPPEDASKYDGKCAARQASGYNSGMGLIFHKVAVINPISVDPTAPIEAYSVAVPQLLASRGTWMMGAVAIMLAACVGALALVRLKGVRPTSPSDDADVYLDPEFNAASAPKE